MPGIGRPHREAAHGPLPTLVVAVEEVDGERGLLLVDLVESGAHLVVVLAHRRLPEADLSGGDEEVPRLAAEGLDLGLVLDADPRLDAPAVEDGDARADVAQRHHEIEAIVFELDAGAAAGDGDDVAIGEGDGLLRVVLARGREHRPPADEQRLLGDPRATLRCTDRGEGRHRQHERAGSRGERGDRRPFGHPGR